MSPWLTVAQCMSFIILTTVIYSAYSFGTPRTFGSYILNVKEIEECDMDMKQFSIHAKLTHCKGRCVCRGWIELKEDFDNDIWGTHVMYMWTSAGWKQFYKTSEIKGCSDIRALLPELFTLFLNSSSCPIRMGYYQLNDVDLSGLNLTSLPELPYNKYKSELKVFWNARTLGCVRFLYDAVPNTT